MELKEEVLEDVELIPVVFSLRDVFPAKFRPNL
jgi:hypothetical protein